MVQRPRPITGTALTGHLRIACQDRVFVCARSLEISGHKTPPARRAVAPADMAE